MTASSVPESPESCRQQSHQEYLKKWQASRAPSNALDRVRNLLDLAEWIDHVVPFCEEVAEKPVVHAMNTSKVSVTESEVPINDLEINPERSSSECDSEVNAVWSRYTEIEKKPAIEPAIEPAIWCQDVEKKMREEKPLLWCDVEDDEETENADPVSESNSVTREEKTLLWCDVEDDETEKADPVIDSSRMLYCGDLEKALLGAAKNRDVGSTRRSVVEPPNHLPFYRRAPGYDYRRRVAPKQHVILPRSSTPVLHRGYNRNTNDYFRRDRGATVATEQVWSRKSQWPPRCERDSNWRRNMYMRS